MTIKLNLDPMPKAREAAVAKINAYFNSLAQPHRDVAHERKRAIVERIRLLGTGTAPPEFVAEAAIRGISVGALANLILSKPNATDVRELERQKALLKIDTLTTPAEIAAFLTDITKV